MGLFELEIDYTSLQLRPSNSSNQVRVNVLRSSRFPQDCHLVFAFIFKVKRSQIICAMVLSV